MDTIASTEEITLAEFAQTNDSRAKAYGLLARLYAKEVDDQLLEQLRTGSIEFSIEADLQPGDVADCSLPELGYKATVRVANVITQSQADGTTRTLRLGSPVFTRI